MILSAFLKTFHSGCGEFVTLELYFKDSDHITVNGLKDRAQRILLSFVRDRKLDPFQTFLNIDYGTNRYTFNFVYTYGAYSFPFLKPKLEKLNLKWESTPIKEIDGEDPAEKKTTKKVVKRTK